MKIRNILLAPMLFIVMVSGFSCGVDRWPEYAAETDLDIWIDSVMRQEYLWYKEMPSIVPNKYFLAPDKFLKEVMYTTLDKNYSYIDTLNKVQSPEYGFNYTLIKNVDIDTLYNALITNVYPHSPASVAGLNRGEWIVKVDDKFITKKNEKELFQSGKSMKLTLGRYELQKVEDGKDEEKKTEKQKGVVIETGTTEIGAEQIVEDDPIPVYEIVTSATGVKVGYMLYNHFTAGTSADTEKYNNKLRNISRTFADAGVTHFVLDLRNNTGGSLECAQLLASLLAPKEEVGNICAHLEYNDKQSYKDFDLLFDPQLIGNGANMDIRQGYVLTSSSTTGIAGTFFDLLYPFNKWEILGASLTSRGVATESFINSQYGWSLNPVVCTVYNSAGEAHMGTFNAKYTVNETSDTNLVTYLPLGDKKETLFGMALGIIDGTYPPKEEEPEEEKPETSMTLIRNINGSHRPM